MAGFQAIFFGRFWGDPSGDESFDGKLRDECLNTELSRDALDAQVALEDFRRL